MPAGEGGGGRWWRLGLGSAAGRPGRRSRAGRLAVQGLVALGLAALAAWRLGRLLDPPGNKGGWSWLYGLCCGVAGAASAAVLDHTWLKQYTAEAFVALAVAVLLARVERAWSWWSLAAFAAAGTAGFLVSNTAPLVSAAGLGGLWLTALAGHGGTLPLRRYWRLRYLSLDQGSATPST